MSFLFHWWFRKYVGCDSRWEQLDLTLVFWSKCIVLMINTTDPCKSPFDFLANSIYSPMYWCVTCRLLSWQSHHLLMLLLRNYVYCLFLYLRYEGFDAFFSKGRKSFNMASQNNLKSPFIFLKHVYSQSDMSWLVLVMEGRVCMCVHVRVCWMGVGGFFLNFAQLLKSIIQSISILYCLKCQSHMMSQLFYFQVIDAT